MGMLVGFHLVLDNLDQNLEEVGVLLKSIHKVADDIIQRCASCDSLRRQVGPAFLFFVTFAGTFGKRNHFLQVRNELHTMTSGSNSSG